jgi:hypothetical protein
VESAHTSARGAGGYSSRALVFIASISILIISANSLTKIGADDNALMQTLQGEKHMIIPC